MTLVDFLGQRLDEDEAAARAWTHFTIAESIYHSCAATRTEDEAGDLEWGEDACDCGLATRRARVLREVEAKRAILEVYTEVIAEIRRAHVEDEQVGMMRSARAGLDVAIQALATVYQDHPDYREEWRP